MASNLTNGLRSGLRQSVASGLGAGDIFSTASLDLNFARYKRLDSRVTHTRASSATYVGGDGTIKDAVTNLLNYSEEFDNASWSKSSVTVTANSLTAPNGTISADTLTDTSDGSAAAHTVITPNQSFTSGLEYTVSVYAKAGTLPGVSFIFGSAAFGSNLNARFNVTTGTVESLSAGLTGSIAAVGDGWYRCSATATATATASTTIQIRTATASTSFYQGDGTGTIYIWGAQLEESSTVGEYVKTTSTINSAPRFDHNPTTGESLGLLVEESRTNFLNYSENLVTSPWQTPTGSTLSLSTELAPDGTATAYKYTATSSSNYFYYLNAGPTTSTAATLSFWVKNISATNVDVGVLDTSPVGWIINPGHAGSNYISEINTNGWTRVERTFIVGSAAVHVYPIHGVNDGGELLIWGVQLEAGAFPTSYIRTEGSTVTRSADVTSIEGNDFGTFNLFKRSEDFLNGIWVKSNSFIIPDTALAPDNTFTADKLVEDATLNDHFVRQLGTFVSGNTYTYSIYAKAGERTRIRLKAGNTTTFAAQQFFDLSTGTVISDGSSLGSGTITDVGNGWYRLALTGIAGATADTNVVHTLIESGTTTSYTGDGTSGLYLWGVQLEESSTATPYVKSDVTFTSRASTATYYDYTGIIRTAPVNEARTSAFLPDGSGNFVSAGELLLEDAGTNLLTYSEEFERSIYTKQGVTVNANSTTAPDGTNNADYLQEDTATSRHRVQASGFSVSSGTVYTASVYVKSSTRNFLLNANQLFAARSSFSLTGDGSVLQTDSGSATITNVGNGWYRCTVTGTALFTQTASVFYQAQDGSSDVDYTGDGTSGIYLWGAQVEQSAYPTSYIPTFGSTATRAADVSSSSSNTFGNSFYNQTEGTVFSDTFTPVDSISGLFNHDYTFHDGTGAEAIRVVSSAGYGFTGHQINMIDGNSTQFSNTDGTKGIFNKFAIGYKLNDTAASANSSTPSTDTSCTIPLVTKLSLGGSHSASNTKLTQLKRLTVWPTRLSNDTLKTITA